MKFNGINAEFQKELVEKLANASNENKAETIVEVIEKINEAAHADIISQIMEEKEAVEAGRTRAEAVGIRTSFSADEKKFYEALKAGAARQSITAAQIDIIPTTIIDRTLASVKEASDTLKLVKFAPAGVGKWLVGSKTGAAAWGQINAALTAEITGALTSISVDAKKLTAYCIIPKSIRKLEIGYVDKYFAAVLSEAMHDGLVSGFLDGDGLNAPVGIMRNYAVGSVDAQGKRTAKTVATTVTGFSPKQLAPVRKALSNNGTRKVSTLYLICNPADEADYVDPSLYYFNGMGYTPTTHTLIEKIVEPMCPQGKAVFTIDQAYTMGCDSVEVKEYTETKALDDADVIIAKVHANGLADDANTSYVIDVTKLKEFVPTYNTVSA